MSRLTTRRQQAPIQFFGENKDQANVSAIVEQPRWKILSVKVGPIIGYQQNNSDRNGHRPSFRTRVRKDLTKNVSTDDDGVAFKVAFNGQPAPKGPG